MLSSFSYETVTEVEDSSEGTSIISEDSSFSGGPGNTLALGSTGGYTTDGTAEG